MPVESRDEIKKDTRGYIKVSLDFLENHKTTPMSPVAKLTLIELWIYCARNRTDGVVATSRARKVPRRIRDVLTAAGSWHHHECTTATPCLHGVCTVAAPCGQGFYLMHDYGKHQTLYADRATRAGKDTRGYIKVSFDFLENHKTGPMSPVAKLTLIELWIYCARNRTNGIIATAHTRKMAPRRIRDVFTTARSWHHHACTTATPCRHGACTVATPCRQGFSIMHDYRKHQNHYCDHSGKGEKARSAGQSGRQVRAADTSASASETATEIASETTDAGAGLAYASHKLQVIYPSIPLGDNPAVRDAREGKPLPPPRPALRRRHGGEDVADRLNAAAPEIPATPAMRQRVLARLAPDAVEVLADPHAGAVRRAQAQADLDRAAALIDARAEFLDTGEVGENPTVDRLFDPHGDTGYARRMAAAQQRLPVPDPVTPGEVRAMAFRLARDHIDAITRHGGRAPGSARESLRAELEVLLGDGVHQDLLRTELAAMLNSGVWAASKLRERIQAARL
ncbi:hypothetical protein [Nocardia anaemiae]|uniref:hypothetical protein n=1 Tax=Nocardia anaemiae TaxID=263910 RepID=UPI0007A39866|nr:hypothetical protein [Nocardia anaemiae]